MVRTDGSATQAAVWHLANQNTPIRDLADAVHFLCVLHGRHPGVIELAANHSGTDAAQGWLSVAADAFAQERGYLATLAAAAGPPPSTPGQADSETAVMAQHHALETLGKSDRIGCALGAAITLVLEWHAIRQALDSTARRLGVDVPDCDLPPDHESAALVSALAGSLSVERALLFGADQLLAQHRGLWQLVETRVEARDQL
ncbi:DUF6975 family protein [Stakelama marina]|uniref:Uncharacterized protein n=1 Tax=Stakelama marina TaxID=2826939 RepID=A0A8T4I920_9SPHN|nr:hypothetical protein [Stakelama marina]MBR0551488.1 hypothetical protein [Stakelama marina]